MTNYKHNEMYFQPVPLCVVTHRMHQSDLIEYLPHSAHDCPAARTNWKFAQVKDIMSAEMWYSLLLFVICFSLLFYVCCSHSFNAHISYSFIMTWPQWDTIYIIQLAYIICVHLLFFISFPLTPNSWQIVLHARESCARTFWHWIQWTQILATTAIHIHQSFSRVDFASNQIIHKIFDSNQ